MDDAAAHAQQLADLHDRLHVIPAPDWLPAIDDGDRLVHLDLHPMNVIMTASGPVVIDWTNAARGDPLVDVAMTIVLLTCPRMPGSRILNVAATPLRAYLARVFRALPRPRARRHLDFVGRLKALDGNMTVEEVAACERLAERARDVPAADERVTSDGQYVVRSQAWVLMVGFASSRRLRRVASATPGGHRDDGSPRSRHPVHHLPCLVARRFRQQPARCPPRLRPEGR